MKIITICGSLKYMDEIMKITEEMTLRGNCVLSIVYPARCDLNKYSKEEKEMFGAMHRERIRLSDAILVVNIDDYIGESTRGEIEFARSLNKEILYYTDFTT